MPSFRCGWNIVCQCWTLSVCWDRDPAHTAGCYLWRKWFEVNLTMPKIWISQRIMKDD